MTEISFTKRREKYFQNNRAKIISQLGFAKKNVYFYQKALELINPNAIKTYNDFTQKIPVISSRMVIERPRNFASRLPIKFVRTSSSTTGKPKKILLTKNDLAHWAKEGRLSITPYFKEGMTIAHSFRREKNYLSSLDKSVKEAGGKIITFDPRNKKDIIRAIEKSDIILDYAELIYYISQAIQEEHVSLKKKLILSYTGNRLDSQDVATIKRNFKSIGVKAEIYSEYATTEIGPIGCSDNKKNNLYKIIYDNIAFIEVIDPGTNKPAKNGEIIITALNRTGSVFIRYKVGDMGNLSFENNAPYFFLEKRKCGVKIASLFFSPEQVFLLIRRFLRQPLYCNIDVKQDKSNSLVSINITASAKISSEALESLRKKMLLSLEYIDDIGTTVSLELTVKRGALNDKQIRKGFRFTFAEC